MKIPLPVKTGSDAAAGGATAVKKGKKGRRALLAAVAAVAVVAVAARMLLPGKAGGITMNELYTLSRTDITDSVSATGTVESQNSELVYSSLNYPIRKIHVSVGDQVEEGQLLCEVDTTDLRKQLESKELQARLSQQNSDLQVKSAQDTYNAQASAVANGTNDAMLSANDAVEDAKLALNNTQADYAEALRTYQRAKDAWNSTAAAFLPEDARGDSAADYVEATQLQQQRQAEYDQALSAREQVMLEYEQLMADTAAEDAAIDAAKAKLDAADTVLANVSNALQVIGVTLDSSANAVLNLLSSGLAKYSSTGYDSFNTTLTAYQQAREALTQQARSLTTAANTYDRALRSRAITETNVQNQMTDAKNTLDSALLSAQNQSSTELELEQLRESLQEATVYSPIAGTVTASYAVEDSPISTTSGGLGLLFVVEDLNNLQIKTSVDEYDIAGLYVGMPVTIRSDAAGDEEYEGVVSFIAPTTTKTAQGASAEPGKGEFAIEIAVTSQNTRLRVGTGARVSFILDQQKDTLAVPYEAIYTNAMGESCVLKLDSSTGAAILTECPVTTGMENDAYIAIAGEGLAEGDVILTSPGAYTGMIGQAAPLDGQLSAAMAPAAAADDSAAQTDAQPGLRVSVGGPGRGGMGGPGGPR